MISFDSIPHIWLASRPEDMRKGIGTLSIAVQDTLKLSPFQDQLFLFTNKRRNTIKGLYWDGTGFWMVQKKMGKGTFKWPKDVDGAAVSITHQQLKWLLEGLKPTQKTAFKTLHPLYV